MEDNIENEDSLNLDGNGSDESQVDVAKLQETNKKLFERAKKAEAEAKALKSTQHIDNLTAVPTPKIDDAIWDVADYIREGYDRNTVEFIAKNGGREALKDPNSLVSLAVKAAKEQKHAEFEASKTSDGSGLTEAERKYSPEQLKAMSKEELAKILPHA